MESCPTHLIADSTAENDDTLEHRKIADAIAEMILQEERGCAIALTGAWGGGKSTVVELLKKSLRHERKDVETFVFDAWAHQGDPLRRSFLEKLVRYFNDDVKWTKNKKHWNEVVEEIAKRKETVETENTPNLTTLGVLGMIALLLAPAALQVYGRFGLHSHPYIYFIALLGGTLPGILLLLTSIWWLIQRARKKHNTHPLASLFYTSTAIKSTTTSSKSIDPTSIEFEKYYIELITEILDSNKRKILIAVDNLDRVNHEDARAIWATMRVFFDHSSNSSSSWSKRVWVLVPFDINAIKGLWDNVPQCKPETEDSFSHHFLEKTFQTTFRVSPVILTNRRDYLLAQLRVAFPKHSEEEFHRVFRLYESIGPRGIESSTPRSIKIFVNKVGALHRQWQHRIPFIEQAAFTLWIAQNSNIFEAMSLNDSNAVIPSPRPNLNGLLDKDWPRLFMALYFNVDPSVAYQVLLSEPIRKSIQTGDWKELAELEKVAGFQEVFEGFVETLCASVTDPDQMMLTQAAIAFSKLTEKWQGRETCRANFCGVALAVKEWSYFGAGTAEGINSLVAMLPEGTSIQPLLNSITNSLKPATASRPDFSASEWCAGVAIILPTLLKRDEECVKKEFRVPGSAAEYLTVLKMVQANSKLSQITKYLRPVIEPSAVDDYLSNLASSGQWGIQQHAIVEAMLAVREDWEWDNLLNAIRPRIQTNHTSLAADVPPILKTVSLLTFYWTPAETLLKEAGGGWYFQIIGVLPASEMPEETAICILPLLGRDIQSGGYAQQRNTPQWFELQGRQRVLGLIQNPQGDQPVLQALGRMCLGLNTPTEWRRIAQSNDQQRGLITEFLGILVREDDSDVLETKELIENIGFWRETIGDEAFGKTLASKATAGELSAVLMDRPFDLELLDLYTIALREETNEKFRNFLIDSFRHIDGDDWASALRDETGLIDLAISLRGAGLSLGQTFLDALAAHGEWRFSQDSIGRLAEAWGDVLGILHDEGSAILSLRLWNHFKSNSGRIAGVIPYYGRELAAALREYGPESAFERIVQIVEGREESEMRWLAKTLSEWSPRTKGAKVSNKDWLERVEKLLKEDLADKLRTAAESLGNALKSAAHSKRR